MSKTSLETPAAVVCDRTCTLLWESLYMFERKGKDKHLDTDTCSAA